MTSRYARPIAVAIASAACSVPICAQQQEVEGANAGAAVGLCTQRPSVRERGRARSRRGGDRPRLQRVDAALGDSTSTTARPTGTRTVTRPCLSW